MLFSLRSKQAMHHLFSQKYTEPETCLLGQFCTYRQFMAMNAHFGAVIKQAKASFSDSGVQSEASD